MSNPAPIRHSFPALRYMLALACFLVASGTVPHLAAYAQSCDLSPIATESVPVTVEIDRLPRTVMVRRYNQYTKSGETETGAAKTLGRISHIQRVLVTFDDFNGIYEQFVRLRYHPDDPCDVLETGSFATDVTPEGFAVGRFNTLFEDNVCFNLRFFEPTPGVRKDLFTKKLFGGEISVLTAVQPAMRDEKFYTRMAISYDGNGEGRLKKIAHAPLEGFLQSDILIDLIRDAVAGLDISGNSTPGALNPDDIRFVKDKSERVHLDILFESQRPASEACEDRKHKTRTGGWSPL